METVRLIVRNLVFLVLISAFLEMLLPLRDTRRFVQVVMGLFVLIVVLGPLVSLFRHDIPLNLLSLPSGEPDNTQLQSILTQGQALQQSNLKKAQDDYVKRLEEQVVALAQLVPGVRDASASVTLDASPGQQSMGAVSKVIVQVRTGQKADKTGIVTPVEQVNIGGKQDSDNSKEKQGQADVSGANEEIVRQVKETVTSMFGLNPGQVVVKFETSR